jgi:hypothetical protein
MEVVEVCRVLGLFVGGVLGELLDEWILLEGIGWLVMLCRHHSLGSLGCLGIVRDLRSLMVEYGHGLDRLGMLERKGRLVVQEGHLLGRLSMLGLLGMLKHGSRHHRRKEPVCLGKLEGVHSLTDLVKVVLPCRDASAQFFGPFEPRLQPGNGPAELLIRLLQLPSPNKQLEAIAARLGLERNRLDFLGSILLSCPGSTVMLGALGSLPAADFGTMSFLSKTGFLSETAFGCTTAAFSKAAFFGRADFLFFLDAVFLRSAAFTSLAIESVGCLDKAGRSLFFREMGFHCFGNLGALSTRPSFGAVSLSGFSQTSCVSQASVFGQASLVCLNTTSLGFPSAISFFSQAGFFGQAGFFCQASLSGQPGLCG